MTDDNEPLTITIDKNSKIYIQEMEIDFDDLTEKLEAIGQSNFDQKIYINGDKDISYEVLMRVMAKISSSGYTSIGLVTDIESNMLAKPISISVLLHLLFVVIIITGLPSFDRLEESPMSIVEIEFINNLPAITQEIIEDDSKEESASDKKYSATPNVKPSMRSEESKNMSVLENEEPIEKTTNAKQQEDEISWNFSPHRKLSLN